MDNYLTKYKSGMTLKFSTKHSCLDKIPCILVQFVIFVNDILFYIRQLSEKK